MFELWRDEEVLHQEQDHKHRLMSDTTPADLISDERCKGPKKDSDHLARPLNDADWKRRCVNQYS